MPNDKPFGGKGRSFSKDSGPASITSIAGRTLPHSLDAERGLLSACLIDPSEILSRCMSQKLPPEAFFSPANQIAYRVCCQVFESKSMLDARILAEELANRGQLEEVGGPMYVADLTSLIETTAHANYFIDVVREKFILRRLISTGTRVVEQAFQPQTEGGIELLVDQIEKEIFAISDDQTADSSQPISKVVPEAVGMIKKMLEGKGEISGTATGYRELDKMTHGLHPTQMIVLAARPSMGKTSLAMNIAEEVSMPRVEGRKAKGTLVFSLEMGAEQLAMRLLTGRARVSSQRLREGFVNKEEQQRLAAAAIELKEAPIWIDDEPTVTINQIRAKSRRVFSRNPGMGLIVIDYLQLITGSDPRMPREQQISEISRGVKGLAKELKVPVIVLSQLNRDSEKEKRQPKLSDLRESGSIEQDADVVLLLARPQDADDGFSVAADSADLIIAKQRAGPVGQFKLTFHRDITRFEDYSE